MRYIDWVTFLAASLAVCLVKNPNVAWYVSIIAGVLFGFLLGLWFVGMALLFRFFAAPSRRPTIMQCLKFPALSFCYLLSAKAMLDDDQNGK